MKCTNPLVAAFEQGAKWQRPTSEPVADISTTLPPSGGASGKDDGEDEEWVPGWVKGPKGQVLKSPMWFCFNWSGENAAGTRMVVCMLCKKDGWVILWLATSSSLFHVALLFRSHFHPLQYNRTTTDHIEHYCEKHYDDYFEKIVLPGLKSKSDEEVAAEKSRIWESEVKQKPSVQYSIRGFVKVSSCMFEPILDYNPAFCGQGVAISHPYNAHRTQANLIDMLVMTASPFAFVSQPSFHKCSTGLNPNTKLPADSTIAHGPRHLDHLSGSKGHGEDIPEG